MLKAIIFIFFFFSALATFCQDSLVRFNDLTFNSTYEEAAFKKYVNQKKPDYFSLFLSVDAAVTQAKADSYRTTYHHILANLSEAKYLKKTHDKTMKKLYEDVHEAFLTKYEAQNHFNEIFSHGFYNCVSSSALYGLVFSDLNIPFAVKEKPTHVYLVSYPQSDRILVETTDPSGTFLKYSDHYKSALVEQLKDAKLISEEEYANKTTDALFEEFYFSDQEIGLKELVGIQYINDGLYKLENKELEKAYQQFEKGYYFYPKDNLATLLIVTNAQILNELGYKDISSMQYLAKLSRFDGLGINNENIEGSFEEMTKEQLISKADTSSYRKFFESFLSHCEDEDLNHEIAYIYNLRRGIALYNTGNYNQALNFVEKAYELKPKNLDVNRLFISTIGQKLNYESDQHKIVTQLEAMASKHTPLMENNAFKSMLMNAYIIAFAQAFDLHKEQEGLHYKGLFEKNYDRNLNIPAENVGRAYSQAAVYYFKKGYTSKARNLIKQGLTYAPGNYELLARQRMIK